MSGLLALGHTRVSQVALNPLPTAPLTSGERFDIAYEAQRLTGRSNSRDIAMYEAFERAADAYRQAGVTLLNPWSLSDEIAPGEAEAEAFLGERFRPGPTRQSALEAWDKAAERLRAQHPDRAAEFRDAAGVEEFAGARARAAAEAAKRAEASPTGGFGAFAGTTLSLMRDPVQIMSMPFGGSVRAGVSTGARILSTALTESAIAAGAQTLVETNAAPWRAQIGLPSDFGKNVVEAGVGGAVIGGGLRGLVEGYRALRGTRALDPVTELRADDAAAVAERSLHDAAGNPAGPEGAMAHADALDRATADAAAGRHAAAAVPPAPVRRLADWIEQPEPAEVPQAAAAYVDRTLDRPGSRVTGFSAGFLSEAEAQAMRAEGLPVGPETARILTSDGVRHSWINHGPDAARPDGAPPISRDDLVNWRGHIENAIDSQTTVTDRGHQARTHLVRDAQGGLIVVEEVRRGPGVLAMGNMYRLPPDHGAQRLEQVSGMRERIRRGREAPPVLNANRRGGSPELSSETPGGLSGNITGAGHRFNIHTPAGRSITAEARVVELDTLIASHLDDGAANPAYPHAEGVQPRDRGSAPSRAQIDEIAAGLVPDRLGPSPEAGAGAPVVGADNVVESGNGRVAALRRVFGDPALEAQRGAYLDWLRAQGFDVDGFSRPVLVSRRVSALSPDERRAFVAEANSRGTLAMTAAEQARGDVRLVEQALPLWRGGDVEARANADFVGRFMAGLTPEERGGLMRQDGTLSADGIRRIRAALIARAYGDDFGPLLERLLESDAEGIKAVATALRENAPAWATMRMEAARGAINPAMDETADLAQAVALLDRARREGVGVRDLVMTPDWITPLTDGARRWVATFHADDMLRRVASARAVSERMRSYVDEAMKSRPGRDMFGAEPAGAAATMRALDPDLAAREAALPVDAAPARLQGQRAEVARTSAEADVARSAPEVPAAELLEAQRIAAAQDIAVPVGTGEDVVTMGARELLDRADDDIAAAAASAACLIGGVAT